MKKINAAIKLFKLFKNSRLNLAWFQIVEKVMTFATGVQQDGKPMLTKIAVIDMSKEKIIGDFDIVHIWAGSGDSNPIERISELRSQNKVLKELLKKCITSVGHNDDLVLNINLVLDSFE